MEKSLSIIVPVYKVENYLTKCIESLLHQDISSDEYEIILIDDGSPDKCGSICDEYAARYDNISVIHQTNQGLSVARNTGIDAAKGEYIQFVDSDDFLEPNVLGSLIRTAEANDLDILRFNYQNINELGEVFEPNKQSKPFVDFSSSVCDGRTFLNERLGYACYACQFIIKSALFSGHTNLFKSGIYFEDTEWAPRILLQCKRVSSTENIVYNYLVRVGSITKSVDIKKKQKILNDKISLIQSLNYHLSLHPDIIWFKGMIAQTAASFVSYLSNNFYEQRREYLQKFNQLRIRPLSYHHSSNSGKNKIRLINISPYLAIWIIHIKNRKRI